MYSKCSINNNNASNNNNINAGNNKKVNAKYTNSCQLQAVDLANDLQANASYNGMCVLIDSLKSRYFVHS